MYCDNLLFHIILSSIFLSTEFYGSIFELDATRHLPNCMIMIKKKTYLNCKFIPSHLPSQSIHRIVNVFIVMWIPDWVTHKMYYYYGMLFLFCSFDSLSKCNIDSLLVASIISPFLRHWYYRYKHSIKIPLDYLRGGDMGRMIAQISNAAFSKAEMNTKTTHKST